MAIIFRFKAEGVATASRSEWPTFSITTKECRSLFIMPTAWPPALPAPRAPYLSPSAARAAPQLISAAEQLKPFQQYDCPLAGLGLPCLGIHSSNIHEENVAPVHIHFAASVCTPSFFTNNSAPSSPRRLAAFHNFLFIRQCRLHFFSDSHCRPPRSPAAALPLPRAL